jgi:hypothetical protein
MKLSDCILEHNVTGICKIDTDIAIKCFGKCWISLYDTEYRIINHNATFRLTISKEDAETIIKALELKAIKDPLFIKATTYRNCSEEEAAMERELKWMNLELAKLQTSYEMKKEKFDEKLKEWKAFKKRKNKP